MSLADLYQADIDASVAAMLAAPIQPPKPEPRWNAWSTPLRGITAGAGETMANVVEAGQVLGSTLSAMGEATRSIAFDGTSNEDATKFVRSVATTTEASNEVSRSLRNAVDGYRPDPATAGTAENLVFQLTRVLPKAIGATVVAGPAGAAAAMGLDEFGNVNADLREKGVDEATRLKAAAAAGVGMGAGVALPLAGSTAARTLGLYAVGGPGAFMAQQAATREILSNADYTELAKQYDPLDTTGLLLSALIPAPFAAWGLRGNLKARATEPSAPTIEPVAEPEPAGKVSEARSFALKEKGDFLSVETDGGLVGGTVKDGALRITFSELDDGLQGKGIGSAMYRALIDEAHSRGLRVFSDVTVETPAVRVYESLGRRGYAIERRPGGGAIEVSEDAPVGGLYGPGATEPVFEVRPKQSVSAEAVDAAMTHNLTLMADQTNAVRAVVDERMAQAEALGVDPWDIAPPRPTIDQLPPVAAAADDLRSMARGAYWALRGGEMLRAPLQDGEGALGAVTGRTPWIPAQEWFGAMRKDLGASGLTTQEAINEAVEKAVRGEPLRAAEQRTVDWMRTELSDMQRQIEASRWQPEEPGTLASEGFAAGLGAKDAPDLALTARAAAIDADAVESAAVRFENDDAAFLAEMRRIVDGQPAEDTSAGTGASRVETRPDPIRTAVEDATGRLAGRSVADVVDELRAAGDIPPLLNNALIAASEFAADPRRLRALVEDAATRKGKPADVLADAIERVRTLTDEQLTQTVKPPRVGADAMLQSVTERVAAVEQSTPDMPVGLDADGKAVTASELLARARKEAQEGTDIELGAMDAPLIQAAINCALS